MTDHSTKVMLLTHAGGSPHHGPNMRWYYLGQALKKHSVEVEIVTSSFFHKYINPPTIDADFETHDIDGIKYHWIRTKPYKQRGIRQVFNQAEFTLKCLWYAKKLSERKPDIVIASSPHPFVVYPAYKIARLSQARYFYEVRDLWPSLLMELGNFDNWHPYILANKAAERYAVNHAEKILSVKMGDYDYFSTAYKLPRERFEYIPNGFLPEITPTPPPILVQELRQRYKFLVGYVGAISTYYGLEDLIKLANQLKDRPDIGFLIIGGGDREEAIRKLAEENKLTHFHMIGRISKQQVHSALQAIDVCYVGLQDLDIHKHGISCNKIYDYMYAAKPILGSYVAGYDPVETANCGTTVKPGNTEELAKALLAMLEDTNYRNTLGRNGREYFDQTHDFTVVANTLARQVLAIDNG